MATLLYQRPSVYLAEGSGGSLPVRDFSAAAGHTGTAVINPGDLIVLTAGTIARAATNASTNLAGYAISSELATFGGTSTTWSQDLYDQLMFGFSQVGTILPAIPGQVPTVPISQGPAGPCFLDINMTAVSGWVSGGTYQVNIGTTGGIYLDATTNLFVFDPSQSNKVLTVYEKIYGPNFGGVGDLGGRIRCYFNSGVV